MSKGPLQRKLESAGAGLHVVFHPIGENSAGGDAIAIKYQIQGAEPQVVVIDTGRNYTDARRVARTVTETFKATRIDVLIITHTDKDHAGGAQALLESIDTPVGEVWMNDPVSPTDPVNDTAIAASATTAVTVLKAAGDKEVPIRNAVKGLKTDDDVVHVVGPSDAYFKKLWPKIYTDNDREAALSDQSSLVAAATGSQTSAMEEDTWGEDSLVGTPSSTTAGNNSSVITLLRVGTWKCLFTADAGVEALKNAADHLRVLHFDPTEATLIQVPHHGSKNNPRQRNR